MIFYFLLTLTITLALLSLLLLKRAFYFISWHRSLRIFAALSLSAFTYLYGCWMYLSVYLKYIFGVTALLIILAALIKKNKDPRAQGRATFIHILVFLTFGTLTVLYFTGSTGAPKTVDLAFPFKQGNYFVLQGGKGLPTNYFHYSYRGAVYAMDIVELNAFGNRARSIYSSTLTNYETFGDTVYSPCSGYIARAKDDNPDNIPPIRERGPSNTNSILIETDSYYVFMAHLEYQKVFVREGQTVTQGEPLALAGNSGFTLEPHLHIQAHQKVNSEPWYRCPPLFITFNGKTYLHFQQIPL